MTYTDSFVQWIGYKIFITWYQCNNRILFKKKKIVITEFMFFFVFYYDPSFDSFLYFVYQWEVSLYLLSKEWRQNSTRSSALKQTQSTDRSVLKNIPSCRGHDYINLLENFHVMMHYSSPETKYIFIIHILWERELEGSRSLR